MSGKCSAELLELALAGNLPADSEELLHHHLEECEACSAAIEQMAGGAIWCREAAALLIGDELDESAPSSDEWSNVDFTVEHLEPSDEPNVLGRLGGYDVLEIIGRGGMGVVLKGFDRELKRCVAIKVLSPHLAQSSLAKKRFAREAQAAAAVVHPNVLAIHQVQPGGQLPFLVMPLVAGESLAERLTEQGRLELKETLRIGMQAAAGLAAAHEQGLVHRDVKPANILLEKGVERAVLTDFGLARAADDVSMTRWGIIAGTPQYMSPEQAQGESLDGRSDLFSLGCVLYEMATGVSPFRADSTVATLRRLIDDPPPAMASFNPELPPWFIGIVDRLLEKDPSRRFASAKEVSELLEGCLAHLQQPTSVPLPGSLPATARRASKPRKSLRKGVFAMCGALGIALLGMLAVQATDPPDIAGRWVGEGWGQVMLARAADGQYSGAYSETVGKGPGKIELKWSRIERRFNGTWREGEDERFGELSIRLVGNEIRGALTTDAKSRINPATPRLADLVWTRVEATARAAAGESAPPIGTEGVVVEKHFDGTWTATLSAGEKGTKATVELAEVRHRDRCWRPDGTLTEKSPVSEVEFQKLGVEVVPKTGVSRGFFVWVRNRMAEPCGLNYEVAPRSGLAGPPTLGLRAIPNNSTPLCFVAWVPETAHSVTVRIGISAGPWEDVASAKYDETGKKQSSSPGRVGDLGGEIEAKDVGIAVSRGEMPKHGVSWVLQRNPAGLPSEDLRVIGLRRDGAVVEAEMRLQGPKAGKELTALFADAWLKQFKEIKLQHRRYEWVEFRDVALQPDKIAPKEKMPGARRRSGTANSDGRGSKTDGGAKTAPPAAPAQKPDELSLRFGGAIQCTNRFHPNFHAETIACSPDGKLIAVGNAASGKSMSTNGRALIDGNWRPRVDVFDADSKLIAALKLTSPEEDKLLAEASNLWLAHWGPERSPYFEVNSLTFSPDGNLIAVGTSVGQVKLFNAHTGKLVRSLDDQKGKQADKKTTEKYKSLARAMGSVESLVFSPDGSLLAVAGESFADNPLTDQSNPPDEYQRERIKLATGSGRLKVWNVTTGTLKHDLLGHSRVHGVAFSPDGNFLASAGSWRNEDEGGKGVTVEGEGAIIWSAWTGATIRVINRPANLGARSVAFSPDNRLIAIGSRNVHNGRVTGNPNLCVAQVLAPVTLWQQGIDISAEPLAFSPDGKNVIVSGGGLSLRFLDTDTGELTRRFGGGDVYPKGYWMNFAVAPDSRTLVMSATDSNKTEPGVISVWKIRGRDETAESPSALPPKTAGIIPQRLHHFPTDDAVGAIACSADGRLIAIGNGCPAFTSSPDTPPAPLSRDFKPSVKILEAETGKVLVALKFTRPDEDAAFSAAKRVANFQVEALAFSPDGSVLAVGTSLGQIKLFNVRSGELVRILDDESARLAAKGTPKAMKSLNRAMGSVRSLAFSPDGSLLAVGGHTFDEDPFPPDLDAKNSVDQTAEANASPAHGQVQVWEVKTGTLKPELRGSGCGNTVAFSPDGNLLLGAGSWYISGKMGSGATIWNAQTGVKVRNLKTDNYGFTRHAAFAQDSRTVAFCTFFHGDGGTSVTWLNLADALAGNQTFGDCANWVNAVAFWPEGKNVAVLTNEQSILFMNTETWAVKHALQPLDVDRGGRFRNFTIAPQAYMLAIGGIDAKKQNFVEVWGPRCAVPLKLETAPAAKPPAAKPAEKPAEIPAAKPAEKPAANIVVEIRGHVVDAATGRTVPYFSVQGGCVDKKDPSKIEWGFWSQGSSGANQTGEFSLTLNWSAGDRARIIAGGYLFQPILTEPPKAGVTKIDDLVIALKRGRQISGHLFDHTGKPVKNAGVFVVGSPVTAINLTGGKAMSHFGPPPDAEDKGAGRFATDAQGAFTVMGINSDSKGIAVTCPALDLWVVPIPKGEDASKELEIHLPQPGKLVVHYDIAGAPEKATLFRHLHTWEMPGWEGVSSEVYAPIQQHTENVFDNLAPGKYMIYRCKFLGLWGTRLLDRQTVKIESGKTTVADFVRSKGAPITGQVTGLDQFDAPPAIVVWVVSPEDNEREQRHFDAIPLLPGDKPMDGRFTTERIPPGQYRVKAKVGDSLSPPFAGEVLVTVPEEGIPEPVKIPLLKRGAPK